MPTQIDVLLDKIKELEDELVDELQNNRKNFIMKFLSDVSILKRKLLFDIRNTPNSYLTI
ncbi:MAG: hypothetical protein Q8K42_09985 [Methylobacter sp.]|nr:hypothetical protein [Methylobacter sp.]